MFDEFIAWLMLTHPPTAYDYAKGQWVDDPRAQPRRILAVQAMGGPRPDVDDRKPRFRVIMLGMPRMRAESDAIQRDIYALADAALGDSRPCGAASVSALGEPTGPGFTVEDRAYYMLDFEVIY